MTRYARPIVVMALLTMTSFALSGCAGARLNKGAAAKPLTPAEQISQLQQESKAKDQQIAQLQQALDQSRSHSMPAIDSAYLEPVVSNVKSGSGTGDLRVPGVSVEQLQRALKAAGYDPGSVDGRLGGKTKDAVRRFQRAHRLKADGIVGQKTWNALKRS